MADTQKYLGVRQALRLDSPLWKIQHVDITCDGCETEPIVGHRFKCCTCEDIDLCSACMRALVAARVKMSQEAPPLAAPTRQGTRPRKWVAKLHSRDLGAKWTALQTAVPCLHPSHKFQKVLDGPERAVVFQPGGSSGGSGGGGGDGSSSGGSGDSRPTGGGGGGGGGAAAAASGVPASSGSAGSGLDQFLETFPPSAASCRDVAWIVVSHPEVGTQQQQEQQQQQQQQQQQEQQSPQQSPQQPPASGSDGYPSPLAAAAAAAAGGSGDSGGVEERVDAAVEEWEKLAAAAAASGRRPTAADVDALASKHGILKGKWMLFARSEAEADAAWAAVAHAVCGEPMPAAAAAAPAAATAVAVQPAGQHQAAAGQAGQQGAGSQAGQAQQAQQQQQGPLCQSAKVSSSSPDGSWVLCVYTANYQDGEDVQRVCRGLQAALPRGLLQDRRLLYKPDIYTHLGIYARNEWQLKPTVREARLA